MSSSNTLPALIERLDRQDSLARWANAEPALSAIEGVRALAELLFDPTDRAQADELFGALLRIAAVDCGDDRDAALLIVALLAGGAEVLGAELRHIADIDALVAGELWLQIRSFPWRTRRQGFVKGLLLETRRAVLAAALQERTGRRRSRQFVVLVDPTTDRERGADRLGVLGADHLVEPHDSRGEVTLLAVLEWAQRSGVVSAAHVALLLELVAAGDRLDEISDGSFRRGLNVAAEIRDVAARRGVSEKTVRRHRDSAVAAMRQAREQYFSEACA